MQSKIVSDRMRAGMVASVVGVVMVTVGLWLLTAGPEGGRVCRQPISGPAATPACL